MNPRNFALVVCAFSACRNEMYDQARYEPHESAPRSPVKGAVSRSAPIGDEAFYTGRRDGRLVEDLQVELTRPVLERGRERYEVYCTPCHDWVGNGGGMIVQRGFPAPPSFHISRLKTAPIGHFFEVITKGFGKMYPYAASISARDRWAVAAYVRTLQLSQSGDERELVLHHAPNPPREP